MSGGARTAPSEAVLVVEDDEIIRESIAEVLRDEGFSVAVAENGRAALEWLRSNRAPCLILLDLYMPIMSGMELCARLAEDPALAPIPVVVVSAVDRDRVAALGLGRHLAKPIDVDALLECVRAHGARARSA